MHIYILRTYNIIIIIISYNILQSQFKVYVYISIRNVRVQIFCKWNEQNVYNKIKTHTIDRDLCMQNSVRRYGSWVNKMCFKYTHV